MKEGNVIHEVLCAPILRFIKIAVNACSVNRVCDRAWRVALIKLHFTAACVRLNEEQFVAFRSPLLYRQYILLLYFHTAMNQL